MTLCGQCAAIIVDQADAPGHAGLISLGYVRSLSLAHRRATHEAFTCADCGANWDYLHDTRNRKSGWTRCDRTTPVQTPATDRQALQAAEQTA